MCWLLSLEEIWSTSDLRFVQVISVEKREPRGTFLSLGLRPRLRKPFPRFPFFYLGFKNLLLAALFSTSITWEKPNYTWNIFPESSQNNYSNKILWSVLQMKFKLIKLLWGIVFCWNNCSGYSKEKCFKCNLVFPKLSRLKKRAASKRFLKPR